MSSALLAGLANAKQLMFSSHITKLAAEDKAHTKATLVAGLTRGTRPATAEELRGTQYPSVEAAKKAKSTVSLPMLGKEAGINPALGGGLLGALVGGAREFAALRGAAKAGVGGMKDAAHVANQAAQKKLMSGGSYIRSNAEVRAARNLDFMKGRNALPKAKQWQAYLAPVAKSALKGGVAGAAIGKGSQLGIQAYKRKKIMGMVKKWALPVAAGAVGTRLLLD